VTGLMQISDIFAAVKCSIPILVWRIAKKRVFALCVPVLSVQITSCLCVSWLYKACVSEDAV